MIRVLLFSFLTLLLFGNSYAQPLEFYKEDLELSVEKNNFKLKGKYYFCNTSSEAVKQLIMYPFPEDGSLFGKIDSVSVYCEGFLIPLKNISLSGVRFDVDVEPYKSKCYDIYYSQQLLANKAKYILMTTQKWGKPLKSASYNIALPEKWLLDSLSYQYDTSYIQNNKQIYYWERNDFMPDKDIVIEFQPVKELN